MSIVGSVVVFVVLWWMVLFTVLPLGIRSQHESGSIAPGTDPGAPADSGLWRKAMITTVITAVLWTGIFLAFKFDLIVLTEI